jgi:fibronectin type 3 domain-containing protein
MSHQVTLSWTADTDATTGYNVYRGSSASAINTLLNSTPISATTYQDTTVTPGNWFYAVAAVGANGTLSPQSTDVTVVISLAAPVGLIVVSSN